MRPAHPAPPAGPAGPGPPGRTRAAVRSPQPERADMQKELST
ncbi:hypothetical protein SBD_6525 [Streptomyces bottropensis ATCC 25435]|uniref:Uncharacterized protein n=1 Tax=Streptomyces bottropensis ATCC 25435 TaxID=1054862 RepID=M3ESC4_9ACTN|nr:hypothetical protein SBD_6525 [Streptomyces bottropensis ATCC 25435]